MGGLNLNNPIDFARATNSDVQVALGTLFGNNGGRDPLLWNIFEGSFNGIRFHVFESASEYSAGLSQIVDNGGRRKVKYAFPYRDGQTTDDLGRKAETFSMNIVLHGHNYLIGLRQLMNEFNKPTPGDLLHPVRGKMTVAIEDVQLTHGSEQRKAVALNVTFIEHNFTIGEFRSDLDSTVKKALSNALSTFTKINNALDKIQNSVQMTNNQRAIALRLLNAYKSGVALLLKRMNSTFNGGSSADIPTLLPVNNGGVEAGGNFTTVISPSDPFAQVPVADLTGDSSTVAVPQLEKETNKLREDLDVLIDNMENASVPGDPNFIGALEFYDEILGLKETAVLMQDVLEKGISSSQSRILKYTLPRIMSIREVAYANGLSPNDGDQIESLNPGLLSMNYIEQGTVLKIPVA